MSQIQTIYLLKEVTGREGRKTCRKTMCNEKGEKFWGAEKMGLLIPPGKENKKSFRELVALEQSLEG